MAGIKLKSHPLFPSRVEVVAPLLLDKTDGNFTFSLDMNAVKAALDPFYLEESGLWTPVPTFVTPGNLAFTGLVASGWYDRVGKIVIAHFAITATTITHTTASGNFQIQGLPFIAGQPVGSNAMRSGGLQWQGITKANYTDMTPAAEPTTPPAPSFITVRASGSGQVATTITAADIPTGGQFVMRGASIYQSI